MFGVGTVVRKTNVGDHAVAEKNYDSNSRPTGDLRASLCSSVLWFKLVLNQLQINVVIVVSNDLDDPLKQCWTMAVYRVF